MKKSENYVAIKVGGSKANIQWSYKTFYKDGVDGRVSCFIPMLDIYFQAKSIDEMSKKSKAITTMFFEYYVVDEGKNTLKRLALKLHSLGFKAPNDMMVLKAYSNYKPIATTFTSNKISSNGFTDALSKTNTVEKSLALA